MQSDMTADHDLIRSTASRVDTIEKKIDGFVPEQCIETRTTLKNIEKSQETLNGNVTKMAWLLVTLVLTMICNLVVNSIKTTETRPANAITMQKK